MPNPMLEKNLLALNLNSFNAVSKLGMASPSPYYEFSRSKSDKLIPIYRNLKGEKRWLHSRFSPEKEGHKYCENLKKEGYIIVLGLGAAFHILPLLSFKDISRILIIEPSASEIKPILETIDLSPLFLDSRVKLLITEESKDIESFLIKDYIPVIYGNLQTLMLRSRVDLDPEFFITIKKSIFKAIDIVQNDYAVQSKFGKRWFLNTLTNLHSKPRAFSIPSLSEAHIVGAGPSLEDQIPLLQRVSKNEGIIIATDTSLPSLLNYNITPTYVISIDCQQISYHHFLKGFPKKVPLILDLASPPFLARKRSDVFFFSSDHPLSLYINTHYRTFPHIDTSGGNVSSAAISLAENLGARKIFLYGLDFSYPLGKSYARGSYLYPFFSSQSSRLNPLENHFSHFFLNNNSLIKQKNSNNEICYMNRSMTHYKNNLEQKSKNSNSQMIHIKGKGLDLDLDQKDQLQKKSFFLLGAGAIKKELKDFLTSYLKEIESLPPLTGNRHIYFHNLKPKELEIWMTLLPTAAQFNHENKQKDPLLEVLEWTKKIIRRSVK